MSEAKCPKCGETLRDLYEYGGEGAYEIECGYCEEPLILTVRVSIDYELRPAGVAPAPKEGQ